MMIIFEVYERLHHIHETIDDYIVLDHGIREKGRFKIISQKGAEVRVFLERGKTLNVGEHLKTECGKIIEVLGAEEEVVSATCDNWETFSKACYHLGNRHVKIQVGERWLRIQPDYVLEEMLSLLGLSLTKEMAVFIPESGAYSKGQAAHNHSHRHHDH